MSEYVIKLRKYIIIINVCIVLFDVRLSKMRNDNYFIVDGVSTIVKHAKMKLRHHVL
jgi:hypothetical protein